RDARSDVRLRRRRHGNSLTVRLPIAIEIDAPQIRAATAIAREVDRLAVRGPRRTPVHEWIVIERGGRSAFRRYREEHALRAGPLYCPVNDSRSVGRPRRLHGVAIVEFLRRSRGDVD